MFMKKNNIQQYLEAKW